MLHAAAQLRYLSMTNHLSAARPRSCLQSWARPCHGWTNLKHIHPVHDLWMFISTRFPQHIFLGPYYFSVSFHPVVSARKTLTSLHINVSLHAAICVSIVEYDCSYPVTLSHPAYKFLTENGFNFAFVCCMATVAN